MIRKVANGLRALFIGLIKTYQVTLSPYLGGHCRFEPSCSEYAITSLRRHGVVRGLWLAARRILSCHPFSSKGGWDPVPLAEHPEGSGDGVNRE